MTTERKAKLKEILMDLLFDIIGGILYAAGIYSFASQAEFAPGGISGLAIIINHFTQWPIGICTLVLNIPIVIICIRTLGKKVFLQVYQDNGHKHRYNRLRIPAAARI